MDNFNEYISKVRWKRK